MYHEFTDFDANGTGAERFKQLLEWTASVFEKVKTARGNKAKFRRLEVTAVMMYLQDITKSGLVRIDQRVLDEIANRIINDDPTSQAPAGKSTAGSTLERYYIWWREHVCKDVGIRLDSRRLFSVEQKLEIKTRDGGKCGVCGQDVLDDEADFDHYPIPYIDGGRTETSNARLVHRACHPRGRPRIVDTITSASNRSVS